MSIPPSVAPVSGETRFNSGRRNACPDFYPDLYAFNLDRDEEAARTMRMVAGTKYAVLAGHLARTGRPADDEAVIRLDGHHARCAKLFRAEAATYPDHPFLHPETAPIAKALHALADIYELRAARPHPEDDIAESRFYRLRRVVKVNLMTAAWHRGRATINGAAA